MAVVASAGTALVTDFAAVIGPCLAPGARRLLSSPRQVCAYLTVLPVLAVAWGFGDWWLVFAWPAVAWTALLVFRALVALDRAES